MRKPYDLDKRLERIEEGKKPQSPLDLWRKMGAHTKRLPQKDNVAVDSMLATYKNRVTCTFILGKEVASIHFDKSRGEIFFKGHNLNNMHPTQQQCEVLMGLIDILKKDEQGKIFADSYEMTLNKYLTFKK